MSCPVDHTKPTASSASCPVDHASIPRSSSSAATECPVDHDTRSSWRSFLPTFGSSSTPITPHQTTPAQAPLSTDRETSSIPRGASPNTDISSSHSNEAPTTAANWVYPSEAQFFAAMARKQHNPVASDMKTVVPIHNAVNERTWAEILRWEAGQGSETCGGPRLISFKGRPQDLTPRARVKGWLGYTAPFDRHDWVVDRCGTRIRYVIDFYAGKSALAGVPSFYLDVRPALDGWEGARMRMTMVWQKWFGQEVGSASARKHT